MCTDRHTREPKARACRTDFTARPNPWYFLYMKKQVVVVGGGETFDTYEEYLDFLRTRTVSEEEVFGKRKSWKASLSETLDNDFEIIAPQMPCFWNAKYIEWRIWFEKFIPFIHDDVVLLGHSLGGIFLTKYLSENAFPKKICATFLVSVPFDATDSEYSLADFVLPESLTKLSSQGGEIYFYHSTDDPIVPISNLQKYAEKLPNAHIVSLNGRGHFLDETFPELVHEIQRLK